MIVCFHIDHCKLNNNSPNVVANTITRINQEYEIIFEYGSVEITVHQGKVQNYLRMTLDHTEGGTVKFIMID